MSTKLKLLPRDEWNRQLLSNVHPPDWTNPTPNGRYNLVVLGAGTAGLVSAIGAAGLGAKVALVERLLLGGDCLNAGCVPSKAVIRAARAAASVRDAERFGIGVPGGYQVDFPTVMQRMRQLRAGISFHDSVTRVRDHGVDVYLGQGSFTDSDTIDVDGQRLRFKKAVIATGARPFAPPISGLDQVDYLTNETIFSLTELPRQLGVIGAGPIGCELAQSFARFGSKVYLVESRHGILPHEDREASSVVEQSLLEDGVKLLCCSRNTQIRRTAIGAQIQLESHQQQHDVTVEQLLVAVGRTPNVEGLNLDRVGVQYDQRTGVQVNDRLQTTNPRIFAAGDICAKYKFTHSADFMARIVIQNSLFLGRAKASAMTIPWCTYTSPELAHVGLHEAEARQRGIEVETFTQQLEGVDRAILDGDTNGFVRVHVRRGSDEILGATIVAPHAGDMISEISMAMTHGLGLKKVAGTIHPYPTHAEAIRKVGDMYNRTRLTPWIQTLMTGWFRWTR